MGEEKKNADRPRCSTTRVHNGVEYRCAKLAGHENEVGNEECEAQAAEYYERVVDWQTLLLTSRPLLEWIAANEAIVGKERHELARRILVRVYLARTPKPGIKNTNGN